MRTNKKLALEDETYLMQSSYRTTSQATSRRKSRMKTQSMGDLRRSKHAGTKYLVLSLHTPPDLFSLLINFLWGGVGSAVWWCRRFKPDETPPTPSRVQPGWPHQRVWGRCDGFPPEESYQATSKTFLHASLWGMMHFGAMQLETYIDVYVFESASELDSWMYYKNWVPDWEYGIAPMFPSGYSRYCSRKI